MERLTWRGGVYGHEDVGLNDGVSVGDAICQLAAYEDTGLEPKQAMLISNVLREVGETYNCWFDYVVNCVIENSHLKELAQAEKDGRLVALPPCKAGDYIFRIVDMESHSAYKDFVTTEKVLQFGIPIESIFCGTNILPIEEFGKAVFLTREEAEAALKKREEAGNERI